MVKPGDRILIGVSGGADSVCLLQILCSLQRQMGFSVNVLHVNHGVRPEAHRDGEYVKKLCMELQVPFYLEQVDMVGYAKEQGMSGEEAGRVLRYHLFETYRQKLQCNLVAVAHHQNDRAETLLFNLFRGTGIQGLASLRPVREHIIRPLLCLSREEIEQCLADKGMEYCQDVTNQSDDYSRNKIRHHVIPYAEREICGQAVAHMNETAAQLAEIGDYLELQTEEAFRACVLPDEDGVAFSIERLQSYHSMIQKRILLHAFELLTPYRKDITAAHVAGILHLLDVKGFGSVDLPYGLVAEKEYDRLSFVKKKKKDITESTCKDMTKKTQNEDVLTGELLWQQEWELIPGVWYDLSNLGKLFAKIVEDPEKVRYLCENIPTNRCTKYFDYDRIFSNVAIRTRRTGDYITCDAALHKKSIQDYMVNEKIPVKDRDRKWILADGNHVLWIPGYRISEYYKISKDTKRILVVEIQEEENDGTY